MPFAVEPAEVDFGVVMAGESKTRTVTIANVSQLDLSLLAIDEPDDIFISDYKLQSADLKSGQSTALSITLQSEHVVEEFVTSITLETSGQFAKRLSIPIHGMIVK